MPIVVQNISWDSLCNEQTIDFALPIKEITFSLFHEYFSIYMSVCY